MNVDAVSEEFEMEHGGGTYGKNGQGMSSVVANPMYA